MLTEPLRVNTLLYAILRMLKKPNIPLTLPPDLHMKIRATAKIVHLPQAEVMRQAIRLGLPIFARGFPQPETFDAVGRIHSASTASIAMPPKLNEFK
jgi:hypothetical protein